MLAILFLILKIIGGILLAALLLLVLLILLILFNPIRYCVEANCEKSADTLQASVTFSWLFHLISGKASWQDKELTCRVRILTKKIGSTPQADKKATEAGSSPKTDGKEKKAGSSPKTDGKAKKAGSSPKTDGKAKKAGSSPKKAGCDGDTAGKKNAAQSAEEAKKSKKAEEQTEDKKEKPEGIRLQADAEAEIHSSLKGEASNHPEDRQAETKGSSEAKDQSTKAEKGGGKEAQPEAGGKKEEKKEEKEKKKNTAGDKGKAQRRMAEGEEEATSPLKKKAEKLKYTIEKLCDKINALKKKKDEVLTFIARPEHKAAVQRIFRELKRLLKAIVPKKGNADVTFGFEDPAMTGYALAGISMVYPFAAEHLEITPNFEEKEITAEVYAAGKIRLFYLVRAVVCLVIDKNVRTLYHSVREMTG